MAFSLSTSDAGLFPSSQPLSTRHNAISISSRYFLIFITNTSVIVFLFPIKKYTTNISFNKHLFQHEPDISFVHLIQIETVDDDVDGTEGPPVKELLFAGAQRYSVQRTVLIVVDEV